jgi:endonuclease YncB( thermonuclease family)
MSWRCALPVATWLFLCFLTTAPAAEIQGKVVAVADGDTLTVLVGTNQHKIRLEGIDAPERAQPFSAVAKRALSTLTFGKAVRVVVKGKDRYGRTLGVVWIGQTNVNLVLVRTGMAWQFNRSKDPALARAQAEARKEQRGLWRDKSPVPPWEWRSSKQKSHSPVTLMNDTTLRREIEVTFCFYMLTDPLIGVAKTDVERAQ